MLFIEQICAAFHIQRTVRGLLDRQQCELFVIIAVNIHSSANPTDTIGLLKPQSLQDIETPIVIWEMKDNTIPVILRNGLRVGPNIQ